MLSDSLVAPPGSREATPHPLHQMGPSQPKVSTDHVTNPGAVALSGRISRERLSGPRGFRCSSRCLAWLRAVINKLGDRAWGQSSANRPQVSGRRFLTDAGEASVCLLLRAWVTLTPFHFVVAVKTEIKPGLCRFSPTAEGLADVRGRPASQRGRPWAEAPGPTATAAAVRLCRSPF